MTRLRHTVRTTRRPWEEILVDDATLLDLTRRGQLVEPEPEPDEDVSAELAPDPDANPPASGRRRRRAEDEQPPTTPPAPE